MNNIKRIVMLTQHYYSSRRKANFHFLADAFADLGAEVVFVTTQISPISWFSKKDPRPCGEVWKEARKSIEKREGVSSIVWLTPYHVFSLKSALLDKLALPLMRLYGSMPLGKELFSYAQLADMFIFESNGGLLLADRLRKINPTARMVYRPSDSLRQIGAHPIIIEAEERLTTSFSLISSPSRRTAERLSANPRTFFHPHGIDTELFDKPCENPFRNRPGINAVSVGSSFFDFEFLEIAAKLKPDWNFHVIGKQVKKFSSPNIIYYGEIPYGETVPYVVHADIGLAPYVDHPDAVGLADSSLKIVQYTWCRLPVVAPTFCMRSDRPHVLGYRHADTESIYSSLKLAQEFDRKAIERPEIGGWQDVARRILTSAM